MSMIFPLRRSILVSPFAIRDRRRLGGTLPVSEDAVRLGDHRSVARLIAPPQFIPWIGSCWSNQAFRSDLRSGQLVHRLQKGGIEHFGCHDLATADQPDLIRPVIGDGAMYRAQVIP